MNKITFAIGAIGSAYNAISVCIAEAVRLGLFSNVFMSAFTIVCILGLTICGGLTGLLCRDVFNWMLNKYRFRNTILKL